MREAFAQRYYRLALAAAEKRDLGVAAKYARYACLLSGALASGTGDSPPFHPSASAATASDAGTALDADAPDSSASADTGADVAPDAGIGAAGSDVAAAATVTGADAAAPSASEACFEKAARLLWLCLYELGELDERRELRRLGAQNAAYLASPYLLEIAKAAKAEYDAEAAFADQIRPLVEQQNWRRALRLAESFAPRSIRALNVHGCLYAAAKKHNTAARFFAKALQKDPRHALAASGLASCTVLRKRLDALFNP